MSWSIERWPVNWSIERKLPLFVSALVLAVVLGLLTIGHQQVRLAARGIANDRLQRSAIALAELSARGPRLQRTQTANLAADSGVVAFLASGGRRGRAQALAALQRIARDTASNVAAELWDAGGRLVLRSGRPTLAGEAFGAAAIDSAVVSPLIQRDTVLYFELAADVRDQGRIIGRVQQVRRLAMNAQSRAALTGLAGGNVLVLLGNASGDPWMDFTTVVPAPPEVVRTSPIEVRAAWQNPIDTAAAPIGTTEMMRYERGEQKLGVAARIRGTPWLIVMEVPNRVVLAPAQAYQRRMALIAALVVVVGAVGAWWGSRRITTPLRQITTAAEDIAGGDLRPRLHVGGQDELGRLARSFNTMAERVADSHHRLEDQVAERTLAFQQSEARLRTVTETAHDAIIAADAEGVIRYWNPGATRIFGYETAEILGKPLTVLMPEQYHDQHRKGLQRYVATRDAHVVGKTVELEGRRKDGSEFPLELSLAASSADEGVALSFTGVIRDITQRKRIEATLHATNTELEAFSYSVSHDLRAPLRAIHGFARILIEDHNAQLDPEAQRLLGVIDQNTRHMGQLIDDLLAFSRLGRQELDKERVDMRKLARGIADDVRRAEGDRPLDITVDALPPARGDRALLRQAVGNLVENAAKFTRGRTPARIEIGSRPDGGQTVYFVKDNGAGFDERYAGKLFGVFQRLHRAEEFEGTGVGLAIVQRIVQRHGGRVWAEGKLDQGATFYFTLPESEG